MSIITVLVALLVSWLAWLLAGFFLPAPFPLIVAIIVFLVMMFGDKFGVPAYWR